jgi:hypothetical protein
VEQALLVAPAVFATGGFRLPSSLSHFFLQETPMASAAQEAASRINGALSRGSTWLYNANR